MNINSNPLKSLTQAASHLAQTVKDTAKNLGRLGKYVVSRQQEFGPSPMANQKATYQARQDASHTTPAAAPKAATPSSATAPNTGHPAIDPSVAQDLDDISNAFDKL
jgi:predicted cobalt transporter CbtA